MQQNSDFLQLNIDVITENISKVCSVHDVVLVGVTKTVSPEIVNESIARGISVIGENRVQEYLSKIDDYRLVNEDGINICAVHFIGKLQVNKVKYIIDRVSMIESVDSVKLAVEIDKRAGQKGLVMDILLEVNIGEEESKSGFFKEQLASAINQISQLKNVRIQGLMAIVPIVDSERYFKDMQIVFEEMKKEYYNNSKVQFEYLSMGMSSDYYIAIKYGANIVRIGTALYGKR